jgi:hypothetical protein
VQYCAHQQLLPLLPPLSETAPPVAMRQLLLLLLLLLPLLLLQRLQLLLLLLLQLLLPLLLQLLLLLHYCRRPGQYVMTRSRIVCCVAGLLTKSFIPTSWHFSLISCVVSAENAMIGALMPPPSVVMIAAASIPLFAVVAVVEAQRLVAEVSVPSTQLWP